jgi:diguanylate cyclase (GGDEF)-like protein
VVLHDNREQKEIEARLRHLAETDSLTGIYNRRRTFALAQQELDKARCAEQDLSVILFDVDHFKNINDAFGHQVGDQVLEQLAGACLQELRSEDILGRYGGEEFLIVLPGSGPDGAALVAERLRQRIEALCIPVPAGEPALAGPAPALAAPCRAQVTASLGVASLSQDRRWKLDQLLEQADRALYRAKAAGRNRVCM